jgi:putative transposase
MVRPMRIEFPGAVYHIAARENERKEVFPNDRDREAFIKTILQVTENHCHLLIAKEY